MEDRLRVGEQAEAERPDHEAGGEVAQHRAQAETAKQRYGNDRGAEKRHHMEQIARPAFDCQS